MSLESQKRANRKSNQVRYWRCGRCNHRWMAKFTARGGAPAPDRYGEIPFTPPKECCPRCGSRYNISSIQCSVEGADSGADVINPDPYTGKELTEMLKELE